MTPVDYALEQPASRASAILSFAVFLPAACSIFVPLGLAASDVAAATQAVQDHPEAALQVTIGLALWTLLFVLPVARRLKAFGMSRRVVIAQGEITETTRTLFGAHNTHTPLRTFDGLVHRVRTSVGGITHELALIDLQRGRDVVFMTSHLISRDTIDTATRTLGLPELRASDLLRFPAMRDLIGVGTAPREATA